MIFQSSNFSVFEILDSINTLIKTTLSNLISIISGAKSSGPNDPLVISKLFHRWVCAWFSTLFTEVTWKIVLKSNLTNLPTDWSYVFKYFQFVFIMTDASINSNTNNWYSWMINLKGYCIWRTISCIPRTRLVNFSETRRSDMQSTPTCSLKILLEHYCKIVW